MDKLKLENEIRKKLYSSYGLDIFEGKEFSECTFEDWEKTFRDNLENYINESWGDFVEKFGTEKFSEIEREIHSARLDIGTYNRIHEQLFDEWDFWLTEQYENWEKLEDDRISAIDKYIKEMMYILNKELINFNYEIVYNDSYWNIPFYFQVPGIEPTKENCARILVQDTDIDDVYNKYSYHDKNITISYQGDDESIIF